MSSHLVFSINPNTCIKCKTCEMSCNEYYGFSNEHRRQVLTFLSEDDDTPFHVSMSCNHCLNPVCVYVCSENNFQKRRDGIVVLDPSRCKGCKKCVEACPYHAPKLNPMTNRVYKCNFCVDRIDEGLRPVCVEDCITSALGMMVVDTKEINSNRLVNADIPLASYSTPTTQVLKRRRKYHFTREG